MARRWVAIVLLVAAAPGGEAAAALPVPAGAGSLPLDSTRPLHWQPIGPGRHGLTAVAVDPATSRAAVGDERGVLVLGADGAVLSSLARPDVTALAFASGGRLLIGTRNGLFVRDENAEPVDRSPSPGEGARAIVRIAACPDAVAAATLQGVFVSRDGERWQSVSGPLGRVEARAVALRCSPDAVTLLAAAGEDVWRGRWNAIGTAGAQEPARPVPGLAPGVRGRAIDVLFSSEGTEIVAATDMLAVRSGSEAGWRTLRPTLAPGASMLRIAAGAGHLWLATDRGLFGDGQGGAWERYPPGAALNAVGDVAADAERVVAATDSGLLTGRIAAAEDAAGAARQAARLALEFPDRGEPAVDEVFRAALDYLALRPEQMRNLRRGLALRGLLPEVAFKLERGRVYDSDRDYDEAFVSGDFRRLNDRHSAFRRDVSASINLSWELGDLAFSPDAIDLSREARAVIQLRDDVLDEITHLFFERQRVLVSLAALGPDAAAEEQQRLRLRADELAAGLDAWTGGWFGRRVPPAARSRVLHPVPGRIR